MTSNPSAKVKVPTGYHLRKIARSGNSRYLSVGRFLPADWEMVKVIVEARGAGICVLRLELIK